MIRLSYWGYYGVIEINKEFVKVKQKVVFQSR